MNSVKMWRSEWGFAVSKQNLFQFCLPGNQNVPSRFYNWTTTILRLLNFSNTSENL